MSTDDKSDQNKVPDQVQDAGDGVGALYHRKYDITFRAEGTSPQAIMARLQADLNAPSSQLLATFEKVKGDTRTLAVGDEYLIHITGPWNGPVRVTEVSPFAFTLATLEGHMEAGQISFAVAPSGTTDGYTFTIESRARSRDRLVDLVYDKIPVARAAQTEMWNEYCLAVARMNMTEDHAPEVRVQTERRDQKTGTWERLD